MYFHFRFFLPLHLSSLGEFRVSYFLRFDWSNVFHVVLDWTREQYLKKLSAKIGFIQFFRLNCVGIVWELCGDCVHQSHYEKETFFYTKLVFDTFFYKSTWIPVTQNANGVNGTTRLRKKNVCALIALKWMWLLLSKTVNRCEEKQSNIHDSKFIEFCSFAAHFFCIEMHRLIGLKVLCAVVNMFQSLQSMNMNLIHSKSISISTSFKCFNNQFCIRLQTLMVSGTKHCQWRTKNIYLMKYRIKSSTYTNKQCQSIPLFIRTQYFFALVQPRLRPVFRMRLHRSKTKPHNLQKHWNKMVETVAVQK